MKRNKTKQNETRRAAVTSSSRNKTVLLTLAPLPYRLGEAKIAQLESAILDSSTN